MALSKETHPNLPLDSSSSTFIFFVDLASDIYKRGRNHVAPATSLCNWNGIYGCRAFVWSGHRLPSPPNKLHIQFVDSCEQWAWLWSMIRKPGVGRKKVWENNTKVPSGVEIVVVGGVTGNQRAEEKSVGSGSEAIREWGKWRTVGTMDVGTEGD